MFLKKLAQITPTDENIPGNSFQCQRFGKMFLNILAGLADMRIDAYGRNVGRFCRQHKPDRCGGAGGVPAKSFGSIPG